MRVRDIGLQCQIIESMVFDTWYKLGDPCSMLGYIIADLLPWIGLEISETCGLGGEISPCYLGFLVHAFKKIG